MNARVKPSRSVPRSSRVASAPAESSSSTLPAFSPSSRFIIVLLVLLAIPRIARILYPQVWIEDESYLGGAFLLARGFAPYRDFPLPHFPLLEGIAAFAFTIAPVAIRTAEVLTALAAFAGSILVFLIGDRIGGRRTGVAASLVFATSSLLFRYHLFEREVFDVVPMLAAVWLVAPPRPASSSKRSVAAGLLFAMGLAIKLTAAAALTALVAQLLFERRRREAFVLGATAIGTVLAAALVLAAAFGTDFIVQVIAFRAVHASFPSLAVKIDEMRYTLDVALAGGIAGIVFVVWTARTRQFAGPLLQLASAFLVLVLLNPTYWAHTGIELLPWLALCAGALFGTPTAKPGRRGLAARRPSDATAAGVCVVIAALLVIFAIPIRNLNWEAGDRSVYGFGYRDRGEIEAAASVVRAHTSDSDTVATPPLIAFAAHRRELVPYAELAGDIADLTDAVHREGYLAAITRSPLRTRSFWDGVEASRERIAPLIDEAVRTRRVGAVINYSEDDLLPIALVNVDQRTLQAAGYELASMTTHYEIWVRRPPGAGY